MGMLDTFDNDTQNYFAKDQQDQTAQGNLSAQQPQQQQQPPSGGMSIAPTAAPPPSMGGMIRPGQPPSPNGADGNQWIPPSAQPQGMGQGAQGGGVPKNLTYGGMLGYIAAQNELRAQHGDQRDADANARANDTQGMMREGFGWKRQDRAKEQFIQSGMVASAKEGGYAGVIHFLETADPTKAIEFTKSKLSLDKDMMSNDLFSSMLPVEKAKALAEGYGILGKMGTAIAKAPADQRQAMYDQMMPLVKTVNPNAPKDIQSATPMFMLSIAQATPENVLFQTKKTAADLSSEVGKTLDDIHKATTYYGADSPQVKQLAQNLTDQQTNLKLNQAKIQAITADKLNGKSKDYSSYETYMTGYMKDQSKDFLAVQDAYNKTKDIPVESKNGETMTFSDINLIQNLIRSIVPKAGNRFQGANGVKLIDESMSLPESVTKMQEKVSHGLALSKDERIAAKTQIALNYDSARQGYEGQKNNVVQAALSKGANPNNIVMPYTNPKTIDAQPLNINQLGQLRDQQIQAANDPKDTRFKTPQQRQQAIDWANQTYQQHVQSIGTNAAPQASTATNQPGGAGASNNPYPSDGLNAVRQQIMNNDKTLQSNAKAIDSGQPIQENFQ